jgi:hypothetical protein
MFKARAVEKQQRAGMLDRPLPGQRQGFFGLLRTRTRPDQHHALTRHELFSATVRNILISNRS